VAPSRRVPELGIPAEADAIVLRAMRKAIGERYPSVRELQADLEQAFAELYGHSTTTPRRAGGGQRLATSLPGVAAELDDDIDSERRLRRADLDEYERALHRRRWVAVVSLPLGLAAAAGAVYYYTAWRAEQPQAHEQERNDELGEATLIASGAPATGLIGQRINRGRSDRDFYRLREAPDPAAGDRVMVEVTALPNIDLALDVYEPGGQLIAHADEGGVGQGEALRWYRVRAPVTVMVTEARRPGTLPTENVSDTYRLTAELVRGPAARDVEAEPNDSPSDAAPLTAGERMRGYLDRRDDVDLYRFDGPAGRYRVQVTGAAEVPLSWSHGARALAGRDQVLVLAPGDVLRLARADRDLPRGQPLPGADQTYEIEVGVAAGVSGGASPPPARGR
jgi:hypothetical protein